MVERPPPSLAAEGCGCVNFSPICLMPVTDILGQVRVPWWSCDEFDFWKPDVILLVLGPHVTVRDNLVASQS